MEGQADDRTGRSGSNADTFHMLLRFIYVDMRGV